MTSSIIASEIYALARRYRLRRYIPGREDITGAAPIGPRAEREILFQLTVGVDYIVGAPLSGYPLPVGGYYERYCFSPVVRRAVDDGVLNPNHLHDLPITEAAYFDHFERTTGLVRAHWDDLQYVARLDPTMLWHLGQQVLAADPLAWTLLMSNEFDLAVARAPMLADKKLMLPIFKCPAIELFKMPAQIERGRLILRHLAEANDILQRADLIDILMAPGPLGEYLGAADVIHLSRLIEYIALSTNELKDFLQAIDASVITKTTAKFLDRLAAIDDANIPCGIADDNELRAALAQYLRDAEARMSPVIMNTAKVKSSNRGGRKSTLQRDIALRWYGVTIDDGPVVVLNEIREWAPKSRRIKEEARFPHLTRFTSTEHYRVALSNLANALRRDVDPKRQRELDARAAKLVATVNSKAHRVPITKTLHNLTKTGERMTKRYVPSLGNLGSSVRFSPPYFRRKSDDARLWGMIQDWTAAGPIERKLFGKTVTKKSFGRFALGMWGVRDDFERLFAISRPTALTAAMTADLAAAVSPISANPTWVVGIGWLFANSKTVSKAASKTSLPLVRPARKNVAVWRIAGSWMSRRLDTADLNRHN